MEALNIPATRNTPAISYNPSHAWLRVVGKSIPENASGFYMPVIDWIKQHMEALPDGCYFEFSLPYFNSSSLKALYLILMEIKRGMDLGKRFQVVWYAEEDDEFMNEAADTFRELTGMQIDVRTGHLEE